MARITDIYQGTTKKFTVIIELDDVLQNITADTVTFTMKINRNDADPGILQKNASVAAPEGLVGEASFELTPAETNVTIREYTCDVQWILATGEEYIIIPPQSIQVLARVSDV